MMGFGSCLDGFVTSAPPSFTSSGGVPETQKLLSLGWITSEQLLNTDMHVMPSFLVTSCRVNMSI